MCCMASTSGDDVVLLDVDVLDGLLEEFFFVSHSFQDINLLRVSEAGAR